MRKRLWLALWLGVSLGFGFGAAVRAQAPPEPETILFNGKIITVDRNFTYAQAIAIASGKILAVGTTDEIRKMATAARSSSI